MKKILRTARRALPMVCAAVFFFGCENIALIGRPTIESRGQPSSVTATVNGVDHGLREIYLRAASDQYYVVSYTPETRVFSNGREYGPKSVRVGDRVQVALREGSDKRLYAEEIRLAGSAPGVVGVRTAEGSVERVLRDRGVLELRAPNGDLLIIYVPPSASAEMRARFESLRSGEYVRLEGEPLGGDRLELLAFH